MKTKKLLLLFILVILFIALDLYSTTNKDISIVLPKDQSALEPISIGKSKRYKLKIEYSVEKTKKEYKSKRISFLFPIPSSNEFQEIKIILTKGFEIEDMYRDIYGNSVIKTKSVEVNLLPLYLTLIFEIKIIPTKYIIPKKYYYKSDINDFILTNMRKKNLINNKSKNKVLKDLTNDVNQNINQLKGYIEDFKSIQNSSKKNINKIYDEKITNLYPIAKAVYHNKALDFLKFLILKNIPARISYGYILPDKIDNYFQDFYIEIVLEKYGVILLDKYLNPFVNDGRYINLLYDIPKDNMYKEELGFFGVIDASADIDFLEEKIWIYAGEIDKKNIIKDLRYHRLYDLKTANKYPNVKLDEFIDKKSSLGNGIFEVFKKNEKRVYYKKARLKYIKEIIVCSNIKKAMV